MLLAPSLSFVLRAIRVRRGSVLLVALSQAIEHLLPLAFVLFCDAQEDAPAADRRRRENLAVKRILGEELKFGWFGPEEERPSRFVRGEDAIPHQNGRGAEGAAESASPDFLSGVAFPAEGDTRIRNGIQVPVLDKHRWHIDPGGVLPDDLAGTVATHRGDVVTRKTATREDKPAISHRGCHAFLRR